MVLKYHKNMICNSTWLTVQPQTFSQNCRVRFKKKQQKNIKYILKKKKRENKYMITRLKECLNLYVLYHVEMIIVIEINMVTWVQILHESFCILFHITLISLGKVWIKLSSLQLGVNSRATSPEEGKLYSPNKGNADGAVGIFRKYWAHVGYSPAAGPTWKKALYRTSSLGRACNKYHSFL